MRHVNVRIIAATNRNLTEEVRLRRFRADLYYRLNVFSLRIPPLRERRGDISLLANDFLQRIAFKHTRFRTYSFGIDTMNWLSSLPWSGNVRELEHAVERAIYTASGSVIQISDFGELVHSGERETFAEERRQQEDSSRCHGMVGSDSFHNEELENIEAALKHTNGNVEAAAKLLGTSRATLYVRLNKYGIAAKNYKNLKFVLKK